MPKHATDPVHQYFNYDEVINTSKCKLCGFFLKGKHATNLKHHLSVRHYEDVGAMFIKNKDNQNTEDLETPKGKNVNRELTQNTSELKKHREDKNVNKPETSNSKNLKMDLVKEQCLRLVTVHCRPLSLLQDQAFQNILNLILPKNCITVSLIKTLIAHKAYEIRSKIANEVMNRFVCIKLDSVMHMNQIFTGVNLHCIKDNQVMVRTLTVFESPKRYVRQFLKDKLTEVLNEYNIPNRQIYCIIMDNDNNVHKAKMRNNFNKMGEYVEDEYYQEDENQFIKMETDAVQYLESDIFHDSSNSYRPRLMICAAHTLQQAIKDAFEENITSQASIDIARKVIKFLRQPSMTENLKHLNLHMPILDCPSKWTTTLNMLVRLLSLKSICESNSIHEICDLLSDNFWQEIIELIETLQPVYESMLRLEKQNLTIGDFFIIWLACKSKIKSIHTTFATSLVKAMERRETTLMDSDTVLEALYLDGRLNVLLSDEQSVRAQALLKQTCLHIQSLQSGELKSENEQMEIKTESIDADSSTEVSASTDANLSEIEEMLSMTEKERGLPQSTGSLDVVLNELRNSPRLPLTENIIRHWSNKAVTSPLLSTLAYSILSVPATQITLETLCSSLEIMSVMGNDVDETLKRDIMIIRCNTDLFD